MVVHLVCEGLLIFVSCRTVLYARLSDLSTMQLYLPHVR